MVTAAGVVLTGCLDFTGSEPCGPEFRLEQLKADIQDSTGVRVGRAVVTLREERGSSVRLASPPSPPFLYLTLAGPSDGVGEPLQGRVARVRVVGADGVVLVEEAVAPPAAGVVIRDARVTFADSTVYANLRARALAGTLRLEIETTTAPVRRFVVPLPATEAGRWTQGNCL